MRYKIVSAPSPRQLEEFVAAAIAEGWRPLGGVAIERVLSPIYYQAMIAGE